MSRIIHRCRIGRRRPQGWGPEALEDRIALSITFEITPSITFENGTLSLNGTPFAEVAIVAVDAENCVTVNGRRVALGIMATKPDPTGRSDGNDVPLMLQDVHHIEGVGGGGDDTFDLSALGSVSPFLSTHLHGDAGNDVLIGSGVADRLEGGDGDDSLQGKVGDDTLLGGSGRDTIRGSKGADRLDGGSGPDLLIGGTGADSLSGGNGRDILIGGDGADLLEGGAGEDILIGGRTTYDADLAALDSILAAWTAAESYLVKRANILSGATDLGYRLDGTTVLDDSERDVLRGDSEQDWFLVHIGDDLADRDPWSEYADAF